MFRAEDLNLGDSEKMGVSGEMHFAFSAAEAPHSHWKENPSIPVRNGVAKSLDLDLHVRSAQIPKHLAKAVSIMYLLK